MASRRRAGPAIATLLAATVLGAPACGGEPEPSGPAKAPTPTARVAGRTGFDPGLARTLQDTLDRVRRSQGTPGAAAAVVMPGAGIWTGASGEADPRRHRRVTDRTLFAAASVTKLFTAALALRLAEDGALSLDDPVARWVPEFRDAGRITVRQLLGHRSGLPDFTEHPAFDARQRRRPDIAWTPRELLRYAGTPGSDPGAAFEYSNTNYVLARLAIERASGRTFAAAMREELLSRADFPRTALQPDERPAGRVAVGHQNLDSDEALESLPAGGRFVPNESEATATGAAGSGLLASAGDLARAADGVLRGSLISPASRRELTRFVQTDRERPPEYGLGLDRAQRAGVETWGHVGDMFGFHAELVHLPTSHVTIVALANAQTIAPGQEALVEELIFDVGDHQRP